MLVAYAVVHGEPPEVSMAEDIDVLSRVIALHLVAATPASRVDEGVRERMQEAPLAAQWGEAVFLWMSATDNVVDVDPSDDVWTEEQLDAEQASFEFRMSPLFGEA